MKVRLNHRITGAGRPLILLHGLFGSMENLGGVSQRLQEHFQIHALDQRNHGRSPHTDTMDYPAMADDVIGYMDEQGLAQACVLGHSMGGKVAMQVALSAPDRVERLVVADIAPVTYKPRHDAILEGLSQLDLDRITSRQQADEALAAYVPTTGIRSFLLKNLQRIPDSERSGAAVFRWRLNLPVIQQCYHRLAAAPEATSPYLGPVLFLKGEDSAYIQEKHRDEVARLFPHARLKVITGTDHWLHAEKPDTFAALCRQFLAE
ncbi:alpha/beta fold hydrolase [Marinobacter sp. SS21]|uniref:alpha/beta fold hydrolase n=1 Tax=Marinobacter sp. SS21 TaxID=2979460 RepID=UPI00232D6C4F|nr:alpha/beta fold hydrolase [Marinobacter sp. SS21]MDC0661347.1 alpha/beta fold hydrolase [Marinobacter sp. SS21]